MTHVFISYSHQDKDYARKLAEALKQQGCYRPHYLNGTWPI